MSYCDESDIYDVTGFTSSLVQDMSEKTEAQVTTLITGYINRAERQIKNLVGIPITITRELHLGDGEKNIFELGPDDSEFEFLDYTVENCVETGGVKAVYFNRQRMKLPWPKDCDEFTENNSSSYGSSNCTLSDETTTIQAGTYGIKGVFSSSGYIQYPSAQNLNKNIDVYTYVSFWMRSNSASPTFTIRLYDKDGNYNYYDFTLDKADVWYDIHLKIDDFDNDSVDWETTRLYYWELRSNSACTIYLDNFNFNDEWMFTAPKGYLIIPVDNDNSSDEPPSEGYKFYVTYCVDKETEILTNDGFKLFKDVTYEDKIATLHPETECLEYQHPTDIVSFPYKGEMIYWDGKAYNTMVTPDHRLWIREHREKKYHFVLAKDAKEMGYIHFKRNAKWIGKEEEWFYLPEIKAKEGYGTNRVNLGELTLKTIEKIPMNLWVKFMGWYLSEGSHVKNSLKNKNYITHISQSNKDYKQEIIELIRDMGFDPHEYYDGGIILYSKQLWSYLKQFGHAKDKYVPQYIKDLSKEMIYEFLYCYMKGDGYFEGNRWKSVSTVSKRMADDLVELFLKIGKSTKLYIDKPRQSIIKGKVINSGQRYILSIHNVSFEPIVVQKKYPPKVINYDDVVYCVEVPNHIMYIRRNGRCMWTGNTYDPFKSSVPYNIEQACACMAGVILIDYLRGIRYADTAFRIYGEELRLEGERYSLMGIRTKLMEQAREYIASFGYKGSYGVI